MNMSENDTRSSQDCQKAKRMFLGSIVSLPIPINACLGHLHLPILYVTMLCDVHSSSLTTTALSTSCSCPICTSRSRSPVYSISAVLWLSGEYDPNHTIEVLQTDHDSLQSLHDTLRHTQLFANNDCIIDILQAAAALYAPLGLDRLYAAYHPCRGLVASMNRPTHGGLTDRS